VTDAGRAYVTHSVSGTSAIRAYEGVFEFGRLEVLDADDGTPLWQAPYSVGTDPGDAGGVGEMAATSDRIYVVAYRNRGGGTPVQRVLDAYPASGCGQAECRPEWSAPLDGSFRRLMIGGDVVYATDDETLVALTADGSGAATCSPLASPRWPLVWCSTW
jgi:outer membrane protein assembly factor BamB